MASDGRQWNKSGGKKKFKLGCDIDKEEIFTYPYLIDDDTVSFIKKHNRIMFIIRGPNSTLKATLSDMIKEKYSAAQLCCADHYFKETFSGVRRTKENLSLSHIYCEKKVESACLKGESPIIVQNTHIRKSEFQRYLEMASQYNYTVIMAITLYKFEVTAEALGKINPDGLNIHYFRRRLEQWEDVAPVFTGWFLSPGDSAYIQRVLYNTLPELLSDGKFCRVFNFFDNDEIWNFFDARKTLYCIAGYNRYLMKSYYLSDMVQECYGKSYTITIQGFLVTLSRVMAIVQISEEMLKLVYDVKMDLESDDTLSSLLSSLNVCSDEHKATITFNNIPADTNKTAELEDWTADESMNFKNCRLIHLAQRRFEPFGIGEVEKKFYKTMKSLASDIQYSELNNGIEVCRLPSDEWLVKLSQKINIKTIFTGLYV